MKNKIIFFLPSLNGGGAERVTLNIIKQLSMQDYEIHLVLVKKVGEYLKLIPKYVKIYDLQSSKTLYSIYKFRKLIQIIQPHIIYSTLYRTHIVLYLGLFNIQNKPSTILRIPNSPKLIFEKNEISQGMRFFLKLAFKNATTIIAQTPQMKDEIIKYYPILTQKVKVIINPLDTKHIDISTQSNQNPFNPKYINIVASGRILPQKGFDILIKSFQKVYLENSNYRLHIIGRNYSNYQEKYQLLIDKLNLNNVINFLGFQHNPYIYYKNSDLFVLSSRWEGLPNTILENLYLNKPIVATKCIPFMTTLIKEGRNGFLVDIDNPEMLSKAILNYNALTQLGVLDTVNTIDFNTTLKNEILLHKKAQLNYI